MKSVKTRERDRKPKTKMENARMPKELMKKALFEAKQKSYQIQEDTGNNEEQRSPSEYANEKLSAVEETVIMQVGTAGKKVLSDGRTTVRRAYEKKKVNQGSIGRQQNISGNTSGTSTVQIKRRTVKAQSHQKNQDALLINGKNKKGGNIQCKTHSYGIKPVFSEKENVQHQKIRSRVENEKYVKGRSKLEIKKAPDNIKLSAVKMEKIRVNGQVAEGQRHAGKAAVRTVTEMAKQQFIEAKAANQIAAQYVRRNAEAMKGTIGTSRKILQAIEKAMSAVKAVGMMLGAVGGMAMIVLVIIVGVLGGVLYSSTTQSTMPLSQEVLVYTTTIERYAKDYGIPEYVQVLQAIMMQESGGEGLDPMQSSECPFNTRYPNTPNAITDPDYSIQVGVRYYAECVREAGCDSPQDMDGVKLSLQGYNYGNGYITWAVDNYDGYSEENALQFSQEQAASHGWTSYGDPEYVSHVLRYYSSGNIFAGLFGNGQMVSIALAQVGNEGGEKFWSWYGFSERVEWCACFVSWCGEQCGLIENGNMPKFSYCDDGVNWFKENERWMGNSYTPSPGTLIFFDWPEAGYRDGVSDHVGIVEKYEDGIVYTVEGNSSDSVKQNSYTVGAVSILGYGVLRY